MDIEAYPFLRRLSDVERDMSGSGGGESGAGARPCMSDWISDLIKIARCHGSIVYVKQLGARSDIAVHGKGDDPADWPEALRCRHFPPGLDPKALAGGSVPAICGEAGRCHETT